MMWTSMLPLLNCVITYLVRRKLAYSPIVEWIGSGDVFIKNMPSTSVHCGVHPGGR